MADKTDFFEFGYRDKVGNEHVGTVCDKPAREEIEKLKSGQTDIKGNAASASKLKTARTIGLSGAATGTATEFDGSEDIAIPVTALDATKLTGVVGLEHLPASAVETLKIVDNDEARFKLTTDDVQNGDSVQTADNGIMYRVIDQTKLDSEEGYKVYTAGAAASVPWEGVTGKPNVYPPEAHAHKWADITDHPTTLPNPGTLSLQVEGTTKNNYDGNNTQTFNVTKKDLTLDKVDNTPDSEKEVKRAVTADNVDWTGVQNKPADYPPSAHTHTISEITDYPTDLVHDDDARLSDARKNPTALSLQFEGVTNQTYDGSEATTFNVTKEALGLENVENKPDSERSVSHADTADSASSVDWTGVQNTPSSYPPEAHTHTTSEITDFPTSLKNPTALTVQVEGVTAGSYDGSEAKTFNVTKKALGLENVSNKADTDRTVGAANKLSTARKISLTGGATGSGSFDGSADIEIPVSSIDANKISGVIGIDHLPKGALERMVTVTDDTARHALTTDNVQLGDTVKVASTGLMYIVVDESKLSTDAGYQVYTAGSAASVPWAGVTGRPTTFAPSAHTHKMGDITDWGTYIYSATTPRTKRTVLAAPEAADGVASFRALKKADISDLGNFGGASSSAAGSQGLVPAPAVGDQDKYLSSKGTWESITGKIEGTKVSSATGADKLNTARTLWGQSFNGSANVSGNMDNVGVVNAHINPFADTVSPKSGYSGKRNALLLYGATYGNDANYLKTSGQISFGDPGPQIMFSTSNNVKDAQAAALVFTDHDTIGEGVSLSLVSNQPSASFIAPKIKALTGFTGDLTGTADKATKLKDSTNGQDITVTYGKAGQASTSWLASWNGSELGSISPSKLSVNYASSAGSAGSVAWANVSGHPTAVSAFTNDAGYLTKHQDVSGFLPKSGGTMTGDLSFAGTGTTGTSKKITFSGSTDAAEIYYNVPSSDQGNLVFNMRDDANAYVQFAYNGTVHSYISPSDGTYHGYSSNTNWLGDNVHQIPRYSYQSFGTDTDTQHFYQNLVKKLVTSHSDLGGKTLIGEENPNSMSIVIFRAYDLANYNSTGYPRYCQGLAIELGGTMWKFGTKNGVWYWQNADTNTWPSDYVKNTDSRLTDARTPKSHTHTWAQITDHPTKLSQFTNDSGFITASGNTWRGITDSYSGTATGTSLSQKGANDLYNALHNGYASSAGTATTANNVNGTYSGNGGQQGPGYFGRNRAGFIMSNASVNGDSDYKNWLYMDNYSGNDVGGATAIGLDRMHAKAFIMQSDANRTKWNNTAEIVTNQNFGSFGTESATGSTIAKRTGSGYLFATYFNQASGAETPNANSYIMFANSDGYLRKSSIANMKTAMGITATKLTIKASDWVLDASGYYYYDLGSAYSGKNIILGIDGNAMNTSKWEEVCEAGVQGSSTTKIWCMNAGSKPSQDTAYLLYTF